MPRKKPETAPEPPKYTLLTNISFVQFKDFRLECCALLIEENVQNLPGEPTYCRFRGFGPDGSWPVFQRWLKPESLPFTILGRVADESKQFMSDNSQMKPIFAGSMLRFADGDEYFLQTENCNYALDICLGVTDICEIWEILHRKAQQYWMLRICRFSCGTSRW